LNNVSAADSGIYSCSAVNTLLNTGAEIRLPQRYSISVAPTPRTPPTFLFNQSTEFSARPGEEIILECPGISNPVSKAIWSRPDATLDLDFNRMNISGYGLHIKNVQIDDEGTYICRLDNGDVKIHTMKLTVLQLPKIVEGPRNLLTNESERLELNCYATGTPQPEIYWIVNGEYTKFDPLISVQGTKLVISSVEKRHAGIVQCFARNEVGEVNEGAFLRVNPKQIDGEVKPIPYEIPYHKTSRTKHSHGRGTHGRKRSKGGGRKYRKKLIKNLNRWSFLN
jgi:brother of ihog